MNMDTESMLATIIDLIFAIDMLVTFNTAVYNNHNDIVEDRKTIAKWYLKGWFIIDLIAIIPFDRILASSDFNSMARIARIGRLYKLAKLFKLFRVFKLMKD